MLSLTIIFVGLVFMAVRYADLPIGRALHSALIAAPASWLMRTPPLRIAILLILLLGVFLAWVELAPLLMAADYAPVLWLADMSVYLDALLTVTVAATALRVRSIVRLMPVLLRSVGARLPRRRRARSSSSRRLKQPPPAEDAPGFAIFMTA